MCTKLANVYYTRVSLIYRTETTTDLPAQTEAQIGSAERSDSREQQTVSDRLSSVSVGRSVSQLSAVFVRTRHDASASDSLHCSWIILLTRRLANWTSGLAAAVGGGSSSRRRGGHAHRSDPLHRSNPHEFIVTQGDSGVISFRIYAG